MADHRRRPRRPLPRHRHLLPRSDGGDPASAQDDSRTLAALPEAPGCAYPYVEAKTGYFLLTGDSPRWSRRSRSSRTSRAAGVPQYVFDMLRTIPRDTHPMTMFSLAILAMQRESVFSKRTARG